VKRVCYGILTLAPTIFLLSIHNAVDPSRLNERPAAWKLDD